MHRSVRAAAVTLLLGVAFSGCTSLRYHSDEELWTEGDDAFDSGSYDDAIPYYSELLRRDEDEARALLMRGVAYERSGEPSDALQDYARAGRLGEHRALLYRANLNLMRGDLAGAEEDLGQLRSAGLSGPPKVAQLSLIGTLRVLQGQPRLAARTLEQAIAEGRGGGAGRFVRDAHYNASQAYYQMGDFGRAYDHYLAYAGAGGAPIGEMSPDPQDAYMLGLLAYLAGDFDASDRHLAMADPEQVAEAAEVLDDPSFGAGRAGGVK